VPQQPAGPVQYPLGFPGAQEHRDLRGHGGHIRGQ
jgi:hypothetical protein